MRTVQCQQSPSHAQYVPGWSAASTVYVTREPTVRGRRVAVRRVAAGDEHVRGDEPDATLDDRPVDVRRRRGRDQDPRQPHVSSPSSISASWVAAVVAQLLDGGPHDGRPAHPYRQRVRANCWTNVSTGTERDGSACSAGIRRRRRARLASARGGPPEGGAHRSTSRTRGRSDPPQYMLLLILNPVPTPELPSAVDSDRCCTGSIPNRFKL